MISQDNLKKLLSYNSKTGIFKWKVDRNAQVKAGNIAGTKGRYISICVDGHRVQAHRLAWIYTHGHIPDYSKHCMIDHINGDKHDNRIENLRLVNNVQNSQNAKIHKHNKSGVKGVFWNRNEKRWRALIYFNNKQIHLGCFKNFKDAVKARKEKEKEIFIT